MYKKIKKLKTFLITIIFLGLIMTGFSSYPGFSLQKEILENVEVNWWQVPVFAVDKKGNPVTNLKESDISIRVNRQPVKNFVLDKMNFDVVLQEKKRQSPQTNKPVSRTNIVFLIFDNILSDLVCVERSKKIAREIIQQAEPGTHFVIMRIGSFRGLELIGEIVKDKGKLLPGILEKITLTDFRLFEVKDLMAGMEENYDADMALAEWSAFYKRKAVDFFNSLRHLYFLLNSIEDNKFLYLLSEGVMRMAETGFKGSVEYYRFQLKKVAGFLKNSGAVLFLINPKGVDHDGLFTGERTLRFLAEESGAKYMEGPQQTIVQKIQNLHRAYYEVAFPDLPGVKDAALQIQIISNRKDITIHTLHSLERQKTYTQMHDIEKELLALNLLQPNKLFKPNIRVQEAKIDKIKNNKEEIIYHIYLPKQMLNRPLELYKLGISKDTDKQMPGIEKEILTPRKKKLKIQFPIKAGENKQWYFTLIDGNSNTALVCGEASHLAYQNPLPDESSSYEKIRYSGRQQGETISPSELEKILKGTARYCEKLKQSAFHYICNERIHETMVPPGMDVLTAEPYRDSISQTARLEYPVRSRSAKPKVLKFRFSYRLIKKGSQIKEKREIIKLTADNSNGEVTSVDVTQKEKPTHFFSEKSIFAPITTFSADRQEKYKYTFIKYESYKNQNHAVIEALPKDPAYNSLYGIFWIDLQDYSVRKIEAAPSSIQGYKHLLNLSKELKTKLYLSLQLNFDYIHDGIRFPTRVFLQEIYKGGPLLRRITGHSQWEKNRTEFLYDDYRFFHVKMDVIEEKTETE